MTTKDEEVQSLALQERMLEEYYADLQLRENLLTRILIEDKNSVQALETLDESKDSELIIPIGGGAHLVVSYSGSKKILLSVGGAVVLQKSKTDAIEFIKNRIKEIEIAIRDVLQQKNEAKDRIDAIRDQLAQLELKQR
ncbi:MAG: hypothetical protein QXG05_07785 [Nitrososphaerota archaeon]